MMVGVEESEVEEVTAASAAVIVGAVVVLTGLSRRCKAG